MLRPSVNKFDRGGQSAHGQQLPSRNFSDIATWREVQERQAQGTWMRTVERECGMMGFKSWEEAGLKAVDRVAWRSKIFGPILRFHQSSLIIIYCPVKAPIYVISLMINFFGKYHCDRSAQ